MSIYFRQLESFPNLTQMFEKFLGQCFQMPLAARNDRYRALRARIFQLAVGDLAWRFWNSHVRNQ